MSSLVQLDEFYFVSPQIVREDLASLKAQGFEKIINNRPDGESDDQPSGESIRVAVEMLGMKYVSNPIELPKLSQTHVDVQSDALVEGEKTLSFCRTGTRSSVLWVLMKNAQGERYQELVSQVSGKGFDLSRCSAAMEPLAKT
ncbi:TIGR01244 family sulfur transferase [Marinomonas sp. 5E14-1]|uniref:TIGR01244 family sulfur transferase n=1 Tax=Marinomonas sp. 5E14-1 TaxID=3153922 RepID=UPI0032654A0F